jgi:hypothetical protein
MIALDALQTAERHLGEATEATHIITAAWRVLDLAERLANTLSDWASPDDEPAYLLAAAHLNIARGQLEQGPIPLINPGSLDIDPVDAIDAEAVADALARAASGASTVLAALAARSRSNPDLVFACSQTSLAAEQAADALAYEPTP